MDGAREQAEAAERSGREHVDVEVLVGADTADRLAALFEQADSLARAGLLLTVDIPPALREFREWLVDELARRLRDGDGP